MPLAQDGAQRASHRRSIRFVLVAALAAVFAVGAVATEAQPVAAAAKKVVIVVGPVGSKTSEYINSANRLASQAASYGASVVKVYSPNATWANVHRAVQGANVLIYLGHGNGWPSPYCCFQRYTKDGFGLNATAGNGHNNVKYWGEYYIARHIRLARNAVVILHRLCYASGNGEPGHADPSMLVARQRVDNYGAGFLRTNASAVFSDGITSPAYVLYSLFKTNRSMLQTFWSSPDATKSYKWGFWSRRTPNVGVYGLVDPYRPGKYYRSVIGRLGTTAAQWRAG